MNWICCDDKEGGSVSMKITHHKLTFAVTTSIVLDGDEWFHYKTSEGDTIVTAVTFDPSFNAPSIYAHKIKVDGDPYERGEDWIVRLNEIPDLPLAVQAAWTEFKEYVSAIQGAIDGVKARTA